MKLEKDVDRTTEKGKSGKVEDATSVVNAFTPLKKPDGSIRETSWTSHESSPSHLLSPWDAIESSQAVHEDQGRPDEQAEEDTATTSELQSYPQIFAGLTFYINGSTAPHISDHKLKHLLSLHGVVSASHSGANRSLMSLLASQVARVKAVVAVSRAPRSRKRLPANEAKRSTL